MKIFLGSSTESTKDMHQVASWLERMGHANLCWDSDDAFPPGMYTLQRLTEISREVGAAIFIFGEDDKTWWRGTELPQTRDNVLIEYGLFVGILGPERALICRKGKPKTPEDLAGITHIDISDGSLETARNKIGKWLERLEQKRGSVLYDYVRIVADNRNTIDKIYRDAKYSAKSIDIVGMALAAALVELAIDRDNKFLNRVLFHNVRARLMFVSPNSAYVNQRAIEDGDSVEHLKGFLLDSVRLVVRIFVKLRDLYERNRSEGRISPASMESLGIRITDFCPYFTIFRTDESMFWGIYTASVLGLHSSVLQVDESHGALFRQMLDHFNNIWAMRARPDENYILRCHGHASPTLNEKLVGEILDESWRNLLTGDTC